MDPKAAGRELRKLRDARGWSRKDLEAMSGVSESAIRNYEEASRMGEEFRPNKGKLRDLAVAFGWPDGAEILNMFGEETMARQFEKEAMSDPEEMILATLTPIEREGVREISKVVTKMVTALLTGEK